MKEKKKGGENRNFKLLLEFECGYVGFTPVWV